MFYVEQLIKLLSYTKLCGTVLHVTVGGIWYIVVPACQVCRNTSQQRLLGTQFRTFSTDINTHTQQKAPNEEHSSRSGDEVSFVYGCGTEPGGTVVKGLRS